MQTPATPAVWQVPKCTCSLRRGHYHQANCSRQHFNTGQVPLGACQSEAGRGHQGQARHARNLTGPFAQLCVSSVDSALAKLRVAERRGQRARLTDTTGQCLPSWGSHMSWPADCTAGQRNMRDGKFAVCRLVSHTSRPADCQAGQRNMRDQKPAVCRLVSHMSWPADCKAGQLKMRERKSAVWCQQCRESSSGHS